MGVEYVQHVTRIGHVVRAYGLDALVVLLTIGAVIQLVVASDAGLKVYDAKDGRETVG